METNKKFIPNIFEEGLEFIEVLQENNGEFSMSEDVDCNEQREIFHEFELMRLTINSGRAIINQQNMTATLTITVPILLSN